MAGRLIMPDKISKQYQIIEPGGITLNGIHYPEHTIITSDQWHPTDLGVALQTRMIKEIKN